MMPKPITPSEMAALRQIAQTIKAQPEAGPGEEHDDILDQLAPFRRRADNDAAGAADKMISILAQSPKELRRLADYERTLLKG
jgi:hypothetical protein